MDEKAVKLWTEKQKCRPLLWYNHVRIFCMIGRGKLMTIRKKLLVVVAVSLLMAAHTVMALSIDFGPTPKPGPALAARIAAGDCEVYGIVHWGLSEMEFAARYMGKSRTICITGSNGKTTTTSLIYKIMRDAGVNVALGGNIGESFAYQVATAEFDWYVLELSSFQLDGMYDFKADVAVLMNITPDHLDRYDYCFQNYVDSKMRITRNQHSRCAFVYSADDEVIAAELPKYELRQRLLPFAAHNAVASSAGDGFMMPDGEMEVRVGHKSLTLEAQKMKIRGLHNCYNAMAAALATMAAGVEPEQVARSIYDFAPVEHRLEPAGERDGVEWINDSKATNVDSVWYALESMTRPVVWIAGGTDKGNDYTPLKEFARKKVKALVCMGLDNEKLIREFSDILPEVVSCSSLDEAMRAAESLASDGDTVLLSPACASFDLFKNYEQRGELFKEWVRENIINK